MSDKTRIRRLPQRGSEDREIIDAILDEGLVCHAGYVTDGRPVVIPVLYVRDGNRLLLHGSNAMGLARAVREESPLCVTVTLLDGLVLARSAFNSSANYRSVVVHGMGRLLDRDEKREAFEVIVDRLLPGRLAELRPSTESESRQTSVIEIPLDEASAKVRDGDVDDDPDDLDQNIWAGVVPIDMVYGEPVPSSDLRPGIDMPDYLRPFRR